MSCCEGEEHQHEEDHAQQNNNAEELIEGQSQEQKKKLKLMRKQRRITEQRQNKKKYMPLYQFLSKNGLKFKTAAVNKNSIQFFRMDNLIELLQVKKEKIQQNLKIKQLLKNWQKIFIYYSRIEGQPHLKWPQQLILSPDGPKSKFASFPFDTTESSSYLTVLIVAGIIAAVLFPIWPIQVKIFLWYMTLYSLYFLIGILIFRLVAYLFGAIFGVNFWLFPHILQNVGVRESFTPLYSCSVWEGRNITSLITRFVVLSLFVFYGVHICLDPTIVTENIQITQTIFQDINDWGLAKMKGERNFSESALTDYSKLLNNTDFEEDDENEEEIKDNNEQQSQQNEQVQQQKQKNSQNEAQTQNQDNEPEVQGQVQF